MSAKSAQYLIGSVFAVLGGWALLAPASVMELAITPEYQSEDFFAMFAIGCFGAQACLFALVAFTAIFTKRTFLAYGIALLPFFVFNYWFYFEVPLLNEVGLLDFVGNTIMIILCWLGWSAADQ